MNSSDKRGGLPRNQVRPVEIVCGFQKMAEGSVLYSSGKTRVLCTASVDDSVPDWLRGKGQGWITAEYQMHPRSNPIKRERRDGRERPMGGRSREIERLIGRSLRAAIDLGALGERSVTIDCDVIEADGGTRTASITGGFIALALALRAISSRPNPPRPCLVAQVAAISVGHVDGDLSLDLCYAEDSRARVDLNLVATAAGDIVEVQGTAEGRPVARTVVNELIDLGQTGISELCRLQRQALAAAGLDLDSLLQTA